MKKIKVHYFHVINNAGCRDISTVLESISTLALGDRPRQCGAQKIRLEDIHKRLRIGGNVIWLLKFSKEREDNWPGVIANAMAARDLELDEDQSLAEDTYVAYCQDGGKLVVQYSHFGVRAPKIKEYLEVFEGTPACYTFNPVITEEAYEKYNKKQIVTSVNVTIDGLTEADVALMEGSGIEGALKRSVDAKASSLTLQVGVDARIKKNHMDRGFVDKLVTLVTNRGGDGDSLVVSVKENEEDTVEAIDLLEARKVSKYNADAIDKTAGRRYEPTQMHSLMEQSIREWMEAD